MYLIVPVSYSLVDQIISKKQVEEHLMFCLVRPYGKNPNPIGKPPRARGSGE